MGVTGRGQVVEHTLAPVFNERSRVLILGTMPSPKSRESGFYYGHPQNRFWRVLSAVLEEPLPQDNAAKREMLLRRGIALWDVLQRCTITGAADSTIHDPVPNDLFRVLDKAPIQAIFTTGSKSFELYNKYCMATVGRGAILLPSPSAANARCTLRMLEEAYRVLLPWLV